MADSRRSVVRWVWCGAHCGSPRRPPRPFRESRPSSVRVLRVLVRSVPRASPTSSTTRRRPIDDGSSSNEGKPRRSGRSRPARTWIDALSNREEPVIRFRGVGRDACRYETTIAASSRRATSLRARRRRPVKIRTPERLGIVIEVEERERE